MEQRGLKRTLRQESGQIKRRDVRIRLASVNRIRRLDRLAPRVWGDPGPVGVDRLERPVGHGDANPGSGVRLHAGIVWEAMHCACCQEKGQPRTKAAEKGGRTRMIREQQTADIQREGEDDQGEASLGASKKKKL